jgi:protease-4
MDQIIGALALFGGITLFLILLIFVLGIYIGSINKKIPSQTIIEINFEKGLIENRSNALFNKFTVGDYVLIRDVVMALDAAAEDKRVKGVIAHITGTKLRYADVEEIRSAIFRFRKSGKPAVVFAETFGTAGSGNSEYYLATAFEHISLQPSGNLGVTGMLSESVFLKGTLEKFGIQPNLRARKEYKTYRNTFTEKEFTVQHEEMSRSIVNSIHFNFMTAIAAGRGIDTEDASNLIAQGPFTSAQAMKLNLVDTLLYKDQAYNRIREMIGGKARFLYLSRYINRARIAGATGKKIALIYGEGSIVIGKGGRNPLTGDLLLSAQTVAGAFRAATRDKDVGAIVFRINSPGGSYIGSDIIWHAVNEAKKAGKPVIVTMGAVAGSGGYFIAMNADKIIAQPSTITGSIGVVGGKFVTIGLFNKLGITFDHVSTSPNATYWSQTEAYSNEQLEYLQASLDTVYNDFINKFASGRNFKLERAFELAKGRIYTGTQALSSGLVDSLGGYREAFAEAKKLMNIPDEKRVSVKRFPEKLTFWERFVKQLPENSEDIQWAENLSLIDNISLEDKIIKNNSECELLKMETFTLY